MTTDQLCTKWGLDEVAVEALRRAVGCTFKTTHARPESRMGFDDQELRERSSRGMLPKHRLRDGEPRLALSITRDRNIVTNQGLDHILSSTLAGGTQITTWRVAISKSNTTPLATHTYASPGYTEIAGSDVDEASRQTWTPGSVSSQSVDNTASPAVYTAAATFTAYGAAGVGGGSAPQTIANTAGGGTLYNSALYSSSKSMTDDDTLTTEITYGQADDGA